MSTNYPAALDSYTSKSDGVDYVLAAHVNDIQDAIVAIETELGTDPAGASADVDARITLLEGGTDEIVNASDEGVSVDADGTVTVKLGNDDGTEEFRITDVSDVEVFSVADDGTVTAPGNVNITGDLAVTGSITAADINQILLGSPTELTISSGAVTVGKLSYYQIDTESDAAADTLDTISGGSAGQILILTQVDNGRDVTFSDGTSLKLAGDFVPGNNRGVLMLMCLGTGLWMEMSRSTN